jgi:uncharacterized surface protein with fasciclin (FAS1) repeats
MSYQEQTTADQTVDPIVDEQLATKSLWETAAANPSLSSFMKVLKEAGLEALLSGPELSTVLAPENAAFERAQIEPGSARNYVLRSAITADEFKVSRSVKTVEGRVLQIARDNGEVSIGGARLIRTDIQCTNGVIHIIDSLVSQ